MSSKRQKIIEELDNVTAEMKPDSNELVTLQQYDPRWSAQRDSRYGASQLINNLQRLLYDVSPLEMEVQKLSDKIETLERRLDFLLSGREIPSEAV